MRLRNLKADSKAVKIQYLTLTNHHVHVCAYRAGSACKKKLFLEEPQREKANDTCERQQYEYKCTTMRFATIHHFTLLYE